MRPAASTARGRLAWARRALRLILPPLLLLPWDLIRAAERGQHPSGAEDDSRLFEGEGPLWEPLLAQVSRYAEWGVGKSTLHALIGSNRMVRSVETSREWASKVRQAHPAEPRLQIVVAELGPVRAWGRPASYAFRTRIDDYLNAPFDGDFAPELILVDGRFRVACFLTALLAGGAGLVIVFDDYVNRPVYHVVEEIVSPIAVAGRQAVFVRPDSVDEAAIRALLIDFKHVMD